jgi:hypothetical protein
MHHAVYFAISIKIIKISPIPKKLIKGASCKSRPFGDCHVVPIDIGTPRNDSKHAICHCEQSEAIMLFETFARGSRVLRNLNRFIALRISEINFVILSGLNRGIYNLPQIFSSEMLKIKIFFIYQSFKVGPQRFVIIHYYNPLL